MNKSVVFKILVILLIGINQSVIVCFANSIDYTTENVPLETATGTTTTEQATVADADVDVDRKWEDLVLGGPSAFSYLGLLMTLASEKSLSLIPPAGYTVQYFSSNLSLHAILSQILSMMHNALQATHNDVMRIRSSMDQIPNHLKMSLLLIQTGPDISLNQLLQYTTQNLERAINEGSAVSMPIQQRFQSIGLSLKELLVFLNSTKSIANATEFLLEAEEYATNVSNQWNLLTELFGEFSNHADIAQNKSRSTIIEPIRQALVSNGFGSQLNRSNHLNVLIPASIEIDQSSSFLDMMATTYANISNDYMINQNNLDKEYLALSTESARIQGQRKLWGNIVSQSIDIARLAQRRHNEYIATSSERNAQYATYYLTITPRSKNEKASVLY